MRFVLAFFLATYIPEFQKFKTNIKHFAHTITDCNEEKITIKNPLANILQKCKIGHDTKMTVLRDGETLHLVAKLQEKN